MANISPRIDTEVGDELLSALNEQLVAREEHYEIFGIAESWLNAGTGQPRS